MSVKRVVFLLLTITCNFFSDSNSAKRLRLRDIKCETTGKSFVGLFCFIRSFKRQSFFTMGGNLTRQLENVSLAVKFERKTSAGNYDNVMHVENMNFCDMIDGHVASPTQATIKLGVDHLKTFGNVQEFCHKSAVAIRMNNITWDNFFATQSIPISEYQFHYIWSDNKDDKIFYVRLFGNII